MKQNGRISQSDRLAPEVGLFTAEPGFLFCSPMHNPTPHFLLYSTASAAPGSARGWRFVLQSVGGGDSLSAADVEPVTRMSRLELLAVVRGLEAIDSPSKVTLYTNSRYVSRGISRCLGAWRENRWEWECYGRLVPIRDHDLWRRVDRALTFHRVECRGFSGRDFPTTMPETAALADTAALTAESAAQPADAADSAEESALLIVPRETTRRQVLRRVSPPSWARAFERLLQSVSLDFAPFSRPAFTRAA